MDKIYYGCDMELPQLELRAMKIDPMHREGEADLVMSRWFDYSRLHNASATYYYAHLYKAQTRRFCETYIDIRTADKARAFVPDDIFMSRDMTSMWLARRAADAIGAPYDFVLQFASDRAYARTFKHFSRPNQLYGEEFEIDLAAAWKESLGRAMRYSREDRFKASQWVGSPIQVKHATFVLAQIKQRPKPHSNLLARMVNEDILSLKFAAEHFSPDENAAAERALARLRDQS